MGIKPQLIKGYQLTTDPSQAFISIKLGNELGKIQSCLGWHKRCFSGFIPFGSELKSNQRRRHFKTI